MLNIKREVGLCSFNGTPMRYQAVIPIVVLPLLPLITWGGGSGRELDIVSECGHKTCSGWVTLFIGHPL